MKLTLRQRLHSPDVWPCRWARQAYRTALLDGGCERYALGSPSWWRLELVASVGWPRNAVRFWEALFALWTAHPGDVWVDSQRELDGVVLRVDARDTWLRVSSRLVAVDRGVPDVLLVPRYRYVAWTPARRGWLA
jgi:hypothetical protein